MATLYKVKFNVQEDGNTGEIGLIPANCPTFNASWSPIMLFHDTFEHWFEHQHKYFTGDAAENIGGEIAAMGAMWYIYDNFIADFRFNRNSYNDPQTNTVRTITYFFDENFHDYGTELISKVPRQATSRSGELEYIIAQTHREIHANKVDYIDDEDRQRHKELLKSAKFSTIANLYRYGYNKAERLFPDTYANRDFFLDFYEYWAQFFRINTDPQQFQGAELEISISKTGGVLSWSAYWDGNRLTKKEAPDLYEFAIENGIYY